MHPVPPIRPAGPPPLPRRMGPATRRPPVMAIVGGTAAAITFMAVCFLAIVFFGRDGRRTAWPDPADSTVATTDTRSELSGAADAAAAKQKRLQADLQREREAEEQRRRVEEQEQQRRAAEQANRDEEKRQADEARDRQMAEEEKKQAAERRRERERDAFASLSKMPAVVIQDLVVVGLDGDRTPEVDLGGFDFEALVDPAFELAIPKDQVDGGLFNALVDPVEGQAGSWLVRSAGRDVDGPGIGIPLATITARDGTLRMKAANDAVARNPRFKLLRRSVLLVKARDPEKPDGPAQVRQKIQLLRPAAGVMEFEVSLLESGKNLNPPRPAGITAAKDVGSEPPQYPLDCEMDYEVRFDYPLEFDGGEKSPVTYARTLASELFCKLVACPTVPGEKDVQTFVGIEVTFSQKDGNLRAAPAVRGMDADLFDLAEIGPILERSDAEFEAWKQKVVLAMIAKCNRIVSTSLQKFRGSTVEKETSTLARDHREEIDAFLERQGVYQPTERATCYEQWSADCQQIQRELTNLPQPGTRKSVANGLMVTDEEHRAAVRDVDDKWTRIFREPLKRWFEARGEMLVQKAEDVRSSFKPLQSPVRIVVTRLTSPAYTAAGEKHDVVLAVPCGERFKDRAEDRPHPQGAARTSTSFD
jgi:hypothetical protein